MDKTDVAIIGAGPYGLALAAHLEAAGVERVVFGHPLTAWRDHMPAGMLLKSEPIGSDIAAPTEGYSLRAFCELSGIDYVDSGTPVSLETFLRYSDWWVSLVPDIQRTLITQLSRTNNGFQLITEDGAELSARRVVVGTGLLPFAYIPEELGALPGDMVSHASEHTDLSLLKGKRVGVVGAGQSAMETAALLHESGVEVELITRRDQLKFAKPNPVPRPFGSSVLRPVTKLGEGWHCWGYYHLADGFKALPPEYRVYKAYQSFGPGGSWWLRRRIEGAVPVRSGVSILAARATDSGARLTFDGKDRDAATYDHLIAGTGYRFDVDRLMYISGDIRQAIATTGGAPTLSRSFESSVPDLFFLGAMASPSLGPNMRFLSGTHFTARRLTRRLRSGQQASQTVTAPALAST
jgi:cation diffusion facilitator CzcD-associated flavoprotein CzcO